VHCYLHTVFCIGTNFWNHQWWWNARYSHRVSHICDIWRRWSENTSQLIPFNLKTTSIITIITEILICPLKCLIGSCTDLNVDYGSCSGQKPKLRPESTPALWSSLVQIRTQKCWPYFTTRFEVWFYSVETICSCLAYGTRFAVLLPCVPSWKYFLLLLIRTLFKIKIFTPWNLWKHTLKRVRAIGGGTGGTAWA